LSGVYTSKSQAARETAEILSRANSRRVRIADGLEGVSLGLWEGQLEVDVRQRHQKAFETWRKDPFAVTPPGGEDMSEADGRTWKAAKSILKKHRRGTVVLVAPPTVVGLVYCRLMGLTANRVFDVTGRLGAFEVLGTPASR
ncbi:MAG: hypothetical protein GF328_05830, partial [Candidatus Latescibacteria bacterium]|nr:hypothetical protein [Candidatus Latescibacterota bacterium]